MPDKLNLALVGCGARAQTAHLPYLKKNPRVNIAALCDRDEVKLARLTERYKADKACTTYNEILNDPAIEAVVITTPPHLHHPMALAALDYGKHVFVEMPIALTESQAGEMISKSKRKRRVLAVAHDDHFRPDAILMRQFMERNEVGELTYAKTGWLRSANRWGRIDWQHEKLKQGSGAFLTLGIPVIDLALFVLGERKPCAVSGMAYKRSPELEAEDTAVAQIRFTDDTVLVVEVSWILREPRDILYLNAYGTKGAALFNPLEIQKEMFNRLVNVAPAMEKKTLAPTSYQGQLNAFINAVMAKTPFPVPLEDALLLARIADGFYRSVAARKEVPLK